MDILDALKNYEIWPPLNPDPNCTRCGGTGYSRTWSDEPGHEVDVVGRCECNVERLHQRYVFIIEAVSEIIGRRPDLKLDIVGHTCAVDAELVQEVCAAVPTSRKDVLEALDWQFEKLRHPRRAP